MSYQVLARKWRPTTFENLVGQEHVLQALCHALDNDRLHHAYLFTGTRGVGKTTIARILARALNCDRGVSSTPCGECGSCLEINDGRSVDLIEVDAASRTKVEDTRELLDNVQYAPTRSRFKIYLIDEVHMLSGHSFNALLKTLEEPPEHVKFLLATTDPQKLPATVLSRCLQFNLKNMSAERVVTHLQHVLTQESVTFEDAALWQLGRAAAGSMRDALSLTDQAIAFCGGSLSEAAVASMLGSVDRSYVFDLLLALAREDATQMLEQCERMNERGIDFMSLLDECASVLHRVAVAQAVPSLSNREFGDEEQLTVIAAALTAEDVHLFYQLLQSGRGEIAIAADPRAAFEMLALRLLAFRPVAALDPGLTVDDIASIPSGDVPEVAETGKKSDPPTAAADIDKALPPWHEVLDALDLSGSVLNIASNMVLESTSSNDWSLCLDEGRANLFNERHVTLIEQAVSAWCDKPVSVTVSVGPVSAETPAARRQREAREKVEVARKRISEDPEVRQLLSEFDGELVADSVRAE